MKSQFLRWEERESTINQQDIEWRKVWSWSAIVEWPGVCHLTSLKLSFFMCRNGVGLDYWSVMSFPTLTTYDPQNSRFWFVSLSDFSLHPPPIPEKHRQEGDLIGDWADVRESFGFHDLCSHYSDYVQLQLKSVAGRVCTQFTKPAAVAAASHFLSLRQTTILFCCVFPACFEFAASQLLLLEQT